MNSNHILKGNGFAYASLTIVNAIASGKGAAFAVDLKAKARVTLSRGESKIEVFSRENEDPCLAKICVERCLSALADKGYNTENLNAKVEIASDIPVAQGLSSSSAVANAVILAVLDAFQARNEFSAEEILKLNVDASIKSRVSITGALDDASASLLGGICLCDNLSKKILLRKKFPKKYKAVVFVSKERCYTKDVNVQKIKILKNPISFIFENLLRNFSKEVLFDTMLINGLLYSTALGYDPRPIYDSILNHAITAGLSGTGPAFYAIIPEEISAEFLAEMKKFVNGYTPILVDIIR